MRVTDENGGTLLMLEEHELTSSYNAVSHSHHELEISTVIRGTAQYAIGDRLYELQPGDVVVLNNIERHRLIIPANMVFKHIVIHFDPSFIWNALGGGLDYNFLSIFFQRSKDFSNLLERGNPATPHIAGIIQEIRKEMEEKKTCYELMVKIKLETVFAMIIRHYNYVDLDSGAAALPAEYVPMINDVIRYIKNHISEDIRLSQLAEIVHVSPTYFSMLFKKFNLVSPVEYIIHKRVERAVELIRTTSMSLTDIAADCGFNNGTNFYKAFRKVTGRTPSSYRNKKV